MSAIYAITHSLTGMKHLCIRYQIMQKMAENDSMYARLTG